MVGIRISVVVVGLCDALVRMSSAEPVQPRHLGRYAVRRWLSSTWTLNISHRVSTIHIATNTILKKYVEISLMFNS